MQNIVNNLHGVEVQIIAIECSMVPMENHERRLTISRSDPHIRNWRTRNKQKNQKGTKYLYNLEYINAIRILVTYIKYSNHMLYNI